ncbi:MAG TPA: 50S ribosomal protein L25/general stress protein Ctc [Casimicrobiaceae bacterium]|nr:50S ribosomal protein L25/general stress protein Ctc [Casimicrobiaceae bacterium]
MEVNAFARSGDGRGAARRLRHSGRAPGIVYGAGAEPMQIELDHNALIHALKAEAFHSSILTMKVDGATQKVLLRDVQMHPFRPQVLHIDFQRVDEAKKIHMKVPLHFVNEAISPAVKTGGAIISHIANELDITCLPKDLPEFIEVDLSALEANKSIHASEIALPAGVTAALHGKDPVVATAVIPKVQEVEAEEEVAATDAAAAAATAAPAAAAPAAEKEADKKEGKKDEKKDEKKADKKK